jgi:hypothetical protein
LWTGSLINFHFNNPFIRWHQSFENYPHFHNDIDDYCLTYYDEFERFKKFKPEKKKVVGSSPVIMREDSDEKFEFYDIQGESLYSNPPEPNWITIDHGLDEDHIWSFQKTLYNQNKIKNPYILGGFGRATTLSHAPWWGEKLSQPAWFKDEKIAKFNR